MTAEAMRCADFWANRTSYKCNEKKDQRYSAQAVDITPNPEVLPEAYHDMLEMKAHVATFTINHLALQIFSFRRPKHLRDEQLNIAIGSDWSNAEVQLWPTLISW